MCVCVCLCVYVCVYIRMCVYSMCVYMHVCGGHVWVYCAHIGMFNMLHVWVCVGVNVCERVLGGRRGRVRIRTA